MAIQQEKHDRAELDTVSKHVSRLDAEEKVRGTVEYTDDLDFEDVWHVKIHRSTVPHGNVTDIDTSEAEAIDGVERVVTREDVYEMVENEGFTPYFGPAIKDQPVLALEKVHYIGDPVAAVIAHDPTTAEEAVDLIDVSYDEQDFCISVDEALQEDSPTLHESFESAETFPDLKHVEGGRDTNEAFQFNLRYGDADASLEDADRVFENTYHTPPVQHMPFEPFVTIGRVDPGGKVKLWTPNQSPHFVRNELAKMFGVPESKIRVEVPQVGGSYGAKLYTKTEPLVALCAYLTGHTVKLKQDLEESFDTNIRHETKITLRTGVDEDGKIQGRKCDVYYDTGAYAEIGPRITKKSGYTASGPYEIPNVSIDSHCVYTNKPPAGAFRGFGVPQLISAYEAQMDDIANELGIDPVEYRQRHGMTEGSTHPTGSKIKSVGLLECLDQVTDAIQWDDPIQQPDEPHLKRGKGVAIGYKACLTPSSSGSLVIMSGDGSVTIHSSSVEIGQGVRTTLAQIVAEELGIDIDKVTVEDPDTSTSPFDTITAGSRSTFHMGNATINAIEDIRGQLRDIAASEWNISPSEVVIENGTVSHPPTSKRQSLGETVRTEFGNAGGTLVGRGYYTTDGGHHDPETGQSNNPTIFWFFGATSATVDVDVETGKVDVKELHNAADVGKAIDPERVKGQIMGGAAHALGQTLHEEMVFEFGQQTNRQLLDYKVPSFRDMPDEVSNIIVEVEHAEGPFGAKGVGETGSFAVTPAVSNAITNATGARLEQIPFTPERVLRAIEGGGIQ